MYKAIKRTYKSIVAIVLILVLCTSNWIAFANNDAGIRVVELRKNMLAPDWIVLDSEESVDKVRGLKINGVEYSEVKYTWDVGDTNYHLRKTTDCNGIDVKLSDNVKVEIITDTGSVTFSVRFENGNYVIADNVVENSSTSSENDATEETEDTDTVSGENGQVDFNLTQVSSLGDFKVQIEPLQAKDSISRVFINNIEIEKVSSKWYVFNGGYFIDDEGYFLMQNAPDNESVIKFELSDGSNLNFKYYSTRPMAERFEKILEEHVVIKELRARIVGHFEAGILNQRGYDSVTAASAGATINKNSDVVLQLAEVEQGREPLESDWRTVDNLDNYSINTSKTEFYIDEQSGMRAVYSWFDGTVSLSGEPQNVGQYEVYGKVVDSKGRETFTNRLPFKVYPNDGKLVDYLREDNARRMQDGKYIWDMEPWYIPNFSDDETVVVPKGIKAWYGSHASGVYGVIGYEIEDVENPTQTLIVPNGADLTLVHMHVKTSVKIVVESGAKLRIIDSSIMGKVVVKDGGLFQMNYDTVKRQFLTGAAINGQLILESGAILENTAIKSNTNYIPNGNFERRNYEPVVIVSGDAIIRGEVYIAGDDAADHDQKAQPALRVENATLTVEDNSLLYLQGGGIIIPSLGGDALLLDNGTITGNGKLVAIGGYGMLNNGGDGVSGNGTISTKYAYLSGGNSLNTASSDNNVQGGNGITNDIIIGSDVVGKVVKGTLYNRVEDDNNPLLWKPALYAIADMSKIDFGNAKIVDTKVEIKQVEKISNSIVGIFNAYGDITFTVDTLASEVTKGIFINDILDNEEIVQGYDITANVNSGIEGKITLKFPVNAEKNITHILHKVGSETERYVVQNQDGYYVIEVDSLSPFALIASTPTADDNLDNGDSTTPDTIDNTTPDTVDNTPDNGDAVAPNEIDSSSDTIDNNGDTTGDSDGSDMSSLDGKNADKNSENNDRLPSSKDKDTKSNDTQLNNNLKSDTNSSKATNVDNGRNILAKTGVENNYLYFMILLFSIASIVVLKKNK